MADTKGFGLDLEILKRVSRDKLIKILEESPRPKELIIDSDLMKLLDRIADAKILRTHGVGKMYRFERIPPPITVNQIVYLIRPTLHNIKFMVDHCHALRLQNQIQFHAICVPRIVSWARNLIEEEGLHGIVFIHEFSPEFIPLDEDVLSLEMNNFFRDAFLEGDFSGGVAIARALNTVHSLYGSFVNIISHGRAAQAVTKAFEKIREDQARDSTGVSCEKYQIGHLFIFDRDADLVTPLLTQLTYEGALDEHYGIRAGVVEFPKEVVGEDHPAKVPLNSRDTVFDNIRNRHFAGVASHLVRKARELQDRKRTTSTMSASQMKSFVENDLRTLQMIQKSLSLHISACEGITKNTRKDFDVQLVTEHGLVNGAINATEAKNYIEDCIARQLPSKFTLRLLCLYSITQRGIGKREYEAFSTQILHSYGYHHLVTLFKLRRMGLLVLSDSGEADSAKQHPTSSTSQVLRQVVSSLSSKKSGQWASLVKTLSLIPSNEDQIDLHNPTHMSYVFNGAYTPVVPHLVSECLSKGFASIADALSKYIPGTTYASISNGENSPLYVPRVAFVLVLGGVTYAEIAALRLLSDSLSVKIIVASTCTTVGTSLVSSAITNS